MFTLTREESGRIDRYAMEELGFPGQVLMENAGRGCVDALDERGIEGPVVILCGKGGNGGDGLVIARHLAIRGYEAHAVLSAPAEEFSGDAAGALTMLRATDVPIVGGSGWTDEQIATQLTRLGADWIIDALLGVGATGAPRPPADAFIRWANTQDARRAAIDLPSGLDADSGEAHEPTFRAEATLTMVAPKAGFTATGAAEYVGEVQAIPIGYPVELAQRWLHSS